MADSRKDGGPPTAPAATDVVVVGGGHNGLVAAAYLARFGTRVTVLERLDRTGGAAVSTQPFAGVDVNVSRYSYLVSLLPYAIVRDLELDVELRSRPVASFTPVERAGRHDGLLVERRPGSHTRESFQRISGSNREWTAWQEFYGRLERAARVLAPTLLEPLPARGDVMKAVREACGATFWDEFVERPLGEVVERVFKDDHVRGVVLTDALIGTQSHAHDPSLRQNRCFLYHLIGSGTGEWRVPIGGMGAVTASLARSAQKSGAVLVTGATVTRIESDGHRASVTYRTADGERRIDARFVLANTAPPVLDALLGRAPRTRPEGNQLKVNMVLSRLPRLKCAVSPEVAFAGTFHIDESYSALAAAYKESEEGRLPCPLPTEVYCHTLTDRSILGREPYAAGMHTLTLFGLHTPARLFEDQPINQGTYSSASPSAAAAAAAAAAASAAAGNGTGTGTGSGATRESALRRALDGMNRYLTEPIEDCLAVDAQGNPCIEARTPLDIERELAMPGGHIFHGDLDWPWAGNAAETGHWGVETDLPNVLICGSGARRGGAVSGLPGRAAALSLLLRRRRRAAAPARREA